MTPGARATPTPPSPPARARRRRHHRHGHHRPHVTGKVAQFGRGVLADVSAKLLDPVRRQPRADRAHRRRPRRRRGGRGGRVGPRRRSRGRGRGRRGGGRGRRPRERRGRAGHRRSRGRRGRRDQGRAGRPQDRQCPSPRPSTCSSTAGSPVAQARRRPIARRGHRGLRAVARPARRDGSDPEPGRPSTRWPSCSVGRRWATSRSWSAPPTGDPRCHPQRAAARRRHAHAHPLLARSVPGLRAAIGTPRVRGWGHARPRPSVDPAALAAAHAAYAAERDADLSRADHDRPGALRGRRRAPVRASSACTPTTPGTWPAATTPWGSGSRTARRSSASVTLERRADGGPRPARREPPGDAPSRPSPPSTSAPTPSASWSARTVARPSSA